MRQQQPRDGQRGELEDAQRDLATRRLDGLEVRQQFRRAAMLPLTRQRSSVHEVRQHTARRGSRPARQWPPASRRWPCRWCRPPAITGTSNFSPRRERTLDHPLQGTGRSRWGAWRRSAPAIGRGSAAWSARNGRASAAQVARPLHPSATIPAAFERSLGTWHWQTSTGAPRTPLHQFFLDGQPSLVVDGADSTPSDPSRDRRPAAAAVEVVDATSWSLDACQRYETRWSQSRTVCASDPARRTLTFPAGRPLDGEPGQVRDRRNDVDLLARPSTTPFTSRPRRAWTVAGT